MFFIIMTIIYKCTEPDGKEFTTEDSQLAAAVDIRGGTVVQLSQESYDAQKEKTGEKRIKDERKKVTVSTLPKGKKIIKRE